MSEINFDYHPQFFTATILEWKHLLNSDAFKDIIINSLLFLTTEKSVVVYGFVIMPNHIHIIWQIQDGFIKEKIQQRFMKYTGQQLKFELAKIDPEQLNSYKVDAKDRSYQIWERNSLSIDLWSQPVFEQKLNYIHKNPVHEKWQLAIHPEDYKYSSAKFYETGVDDFGILTHYAQ
ncbi:transposase [Mucilaginibacter antarcticus]|uniref:Transposase n=1 Tax=Mucilaginibacter antarcticus TaxID=1855725 RepID=A0ABW5XPK5_9SPHI